MELEVGGGGNSQNRHGGLYVVPLQRTEVVNQSDGKGSASRVQRLHSLVETTRGGLEY